MSKRLFSSKRLLLVLLVMTGAGGSVTTGCAQGGDDDIWRDVNLGEVDYQKERNYAVRLYGYYRYVDDGISYFSNHEFKLYHFYEGIFQLDIRYNKNEDDGALVIAGRNLVHPDREGRFMEMYELKPFTFLEKARRDPRHFTLESQGDTTRVFDRHGLAGTAITDTTQHELHISYNALAPDTTLTINLLIVKARLSSLMADAVYRIDDNDYDHVPQGNLKRIVFESDIDMQTMSNKGVHSQYHELTELYVDSVVYMTYNEYRAAKRLSEQEQRERSGYTAADIDRLRQKYDVAPLSDEQRRRIEEQQDWDDMYEQWLKTHGGLQTFMRTGNSITQSDLYQNANSKITQGAAPIVEAATESATKNE